MDILSPEVKRDSSLGSVRNVLEGHGDLGGSWPWGPGLQGEARAS
jgi:hypothetical protein